MSTLTKSRDAITAAVKKFPRPVNLLVIVGAVVYVISPIDLIPDFIPGFGQVDDAAVAWFAWQNLKALFRPTVPPTVEADHV